MLDRVIADIHVATGWQPAEDDREEEDQEDAEEKTRDRHAADRYDHQHPVEERVGAHRSADQNQLMNWTGIGSSRPSRSRSAIFCSSVASRPSMTEAASPGVRCIRVKTITPTMRSTGISSSKRRMMYASTRCLRGRRDWAFDSPLP